MEYKYTGIVLKKKDVGEADRIYTIYTLEAGKITGLASGVRRPQAKLAGALENLNLADVFINRNRGMGKITGAVAENNFQNIKNNYEAVRRALAALSIIDSLIQKEEKDEKIFKLVTALLESLEENAETDKIEIIFQGFLFKLLEALGYKLQAAACAACGGSLWEKKQNYFDASSGGIICDKCRLGKSNSIPVSVNAVKLIRIFSRHELHLLKKVTASSKEAGELEKVSRIFLAWIGTGK